MKIRPSDPKLAFLVEKVEAGARLSTADALLLFETSDLLAVGAMADFVNRRLNGTRVFFAANQHINR